MTSKAPALVVALGGKHAPEDDDGMTMGEAAAEELLAAIKAGDPAALRDAFQALMGACSGEDE